MLTRSIDLDPFDLTIGEKIFRGAKRVGIVFAFGAVALSALDLVNIRSVTNAAEFIHSNRQRVADLPDLMHNGIQSIALASPSPSAVAMIPRGAIAVMPRPMRTAAAEAAVTSDASPGAELAAARHLDAVEVAMVSPTALTTSEPPMAAAPAPASQSASQPIILASADPDSLPVSPIASSPSPAELLHLEGKTYARAEHCLANAIYFEARGEPVSGQIAVAQVVMNRVFSGFYPSDVCAVVYQNANRHLACQFSFACDGKRKIISERGAWARANRIAKQTLDGMLYVAAVGPATHYHAVYVRPNWVREMHKMARYGIHNFYRPIAWGNGADEPVWGTAALAQAKKK